MTNKTYKKEDFLYLLDSFKDGSDVSIEDIQKALGNLKLIDDIQSLIHSAFDSYISYTERQNFSSKLSPSKYFEEIIPRICLGRKKLHTTAIIKTLRDSTTPLVVVVTNLANLNEYAKLLSKDNLYPVIESEITFGIHTITTHNKFMTSIRKYDEENVIVESEYLARPYLESFRPDQISNNKYIVVGN